MASLKKHGKHLVLAFLWYRKAFCEDGTVMKDYGDGWKVHAKLKKNITYEQAYGHALNARDIYYANSPAFHQLVRVVDDLSIAKTQRSMLHSALEMLYDDPDGMWSELADHPYCSDYPQLSLDDVNKLCQAYSDAIREQYMKKVLETA
jgi:hypothetical protein